MKKLTIFLFSLCLAVSANGEGWSYRNASLNQIIESGGSKQPGHYDEIVTKAFVLLGIQAGLIGGMSRLPTSFTHWDDETSSPKNWPHNWVQHVTTAPQFDHDTFIMNGILHPYGGAGYYTMGLQSGLTSGESVAFALIDSTFAWEYGVESFVEVPSIQDLILTPAVGVLLGQGTWYLIQKIQANNGEVLGSHFLGSASVAVLSPWNFMVEGVRSVFRRFNPRAESFANFSYGSLPQSSHILPGLPEDHSVGKQFHFNFHVQL